MNGDDDTIMKKEYETPYLKVEEFNVIDYVSSCTVKTTVSMPQNCEAPDASLTDMIRLYYAFPEVFTSICTEDLDGFNFMSYCYHTPSGQDIVFTS